MPDPVMTYDDYARLFILAALIIIVVVCGLATVITKVWEWARK